MTATTARRNWTTASSWPGCTGGGGVIGAATAPVVSRVDRWPWSFPQYDVGHEARVEAIDAALAAAAPGVVVAGAAYRGLGIASCIAQAREVAARLGARPLLPLGS